MANEIRISGLREFKRSLKQLDSGLPKQVRIVGNQAAEIVVSAAKPRVPIGPGKGGHAKSSVRVASTQSAVRVRGGGKRFPYYAWLDFGGRVGKNRSVRRPYIKKGRYIWAAYADNDQLVQARLISGLTDLAQQAGLEPQ